MRCPDDMHGDALRRLQGDNFDFSRECEIDFYVDFDSAQQWDVVSLRINSHISGASVEVFPGRSYLVVKLKAILTYNFIIKSMKYLSEVTYVWGGCCKSWGVLFDPAM
jgi:hypothetical protein